MTPADMDFLSRIADDRRRRIDEARFQVPLHALRERLGPAPPAGRLERALRRGGAAGPLRLMCEVKRASPSAGVLREDLDPVALARTYEAGGAAAVSLVTEPDHFHGDPEWVNRVRPAIGLPILVKDFVLDSYQLVDAAVRGADGVLLLAALLSEVQIQRLLGEARLLGLDALVEVHDAVELNRALRSGATLVGINNRDLRTFQVDLRTSLELASHVPELVTMVAESGLSRPEDLARLRETRCDAVLVGEALVRSEDPASLLATLRTAAKGAA